MLILKKVADQKNKQNYPVGMHIFTVVPTKSERDTIFCLIVK